MVNILGNCMYVYIATKPTSHYLKHSAKKQSDAVKDASTLARQYVNSAHTLHTVTKDCNSFRCADQESS